MMPVETLPICPAGVTMETLSAWRDDALPPTVAGRLTAHCAGCAACQARLARYADLAATLRAHPQPGPDGRLQAAVRVSIGVGRGAPRVVPLARGRGLWREGRIGGLGALAAALLLVAGFAQFFRATAPHTSQPSGTPAATALAWRAATFPAGFVVPASANQTLATRSLDVAPADGNTAYACMAPAQGQRTQPVIWVTHDRAAHWTERARVPATGEATNCLVSVDAVNAAVAVVDVLEASAADELFVTFDGAATWQPLVATGLTALGRVATVGANTYALAQGHWFAGVVAQTRLVVTSDRFASVRTIDGVIAGQGGTGSYWINPASGALLAQTASGLWQTQDGGATWTRVALPQAVAPDALSVMAVQAPVAAGQPWHICLDESQPVGSPDYGPNTNTLSCTTDGGQTWEQRSGQPTGYPLVAQLTGMALAADGAVLVALPDTGAATPASLAAPYTLWRLPAGSTTWQSLGTVPELNVISVPSPGRGVLWAFDSPELAMGTRAPLLNLGGGQSAAIYTATYQ